MRRAVCVGLALVVGAVLAAQERAWVVPPEARAMKNPIAASPAAIKAGQELYTTSCQRCHGDEGVGDGPATKFIKPAPPEIASAAAQRRMTDGEIFHKISEGKTPMPSMKAKLSEEQRWQIVHFVRSLRKAEDKPAGKDNPANVSDGEQVVRTWFARLNELDGTAGTVDAFVNLYEPDALHTTGPADHQLGEVTYRGHEAIRKMATDFTAAFEKPAYRIETVTANEKSTQLFNTSAGPWGGSSVAVEYVAAHTSRADGKRYMSPGAAFFQVRNGKIRRLRLYMAPGELAEVEPDLPRRRP